MILELHALACTCLCPPFNRRSLKAALSPEFKARLPLAMVPALAILNVVIVAAMMHSSSVLSACASLGIFLVAMLRSRIYVILLKWVKYYRPTPCPARNPLPNPFLLGCHSYTYRHTGRLAKPIYTLHYRFIGRQCTSVSEVSRRREAPSERFAASPMPPPRLVSGPCRVRNKYTPLLYLSAKLRFAPSLDYVHSMCTLSG